MTLETVSFIFGAILLTIAIIGGGFEVKEIKCPQVDRRTRLITLVLGAVFIGFAVAGYDAPSSQGATEQPNQPTIETTQPTVEIEGPPTAPLGKRTYYEIISENAVRAVWSVGGFNNNEPIVVESLGPSHEIYVEPTNVDRVGDTFTITATVYSADGKSAQARKQFLVTSD